MLAEIKSLSSHDLAYKQMPEDPDDCGVSLIVSIGPIGDEQQEQFFLEIITTGWLQRIGRPFWGTKSLIVPRFDWQNVTEEIEQMLRQCSADTWPEVARKISYFMDT